MNWNGAGRALFAACSDWYHACRRGCYLLIAALLCACGGTESGPGNARTAGVAAPMMRAEPAAPPPAALPPAPATVRGNMDGNDGNSRATRFAQLKALPLLSALSEREKDYLLGQLPARSPSQRLDIINGFPKLAALPDRQKEILLDQLETIVPVTVPESLLVCECGAGIRRELCVREDCGARSALSAQCNRACGTLAAFRFQCSASNTCNGKPGGAAAARR